MPGFQGFSFDDSVGRTEPGRARVPEGYYLIECEGMDPTAEDYEKTVGIWNKIRIVQGPDSAPGLGVGGRLRDFNSVGKVDAQFGLGQTLGAYGLEAVAKQLAAGKVNVPSYAAFQRLCQGLSQRATGKRAVALIADQPGQTRPFSGIEALYPEADWATYRQAQVLGQSVAPQAMPSNGPAQPMAGAADLFADLDSAV
jgi:hypothetical protein